MTAYLVLITWPDGTEGLLFPRPGNVQIATTLEMGQNDFETAKTHLREYWDAMAGNPDMQAKVQGAMIRLVKCRVDPWPVCEFLFDG